MNPEKGFKYALDGYIYMMLKHVPAKSSLSSLADELCSRNIGRVDLVSLCIIDIIKYTIIAKNVKLSI